MDRWRNKIAVITGASSGIGAATTKDLVKAGLITVGFARRVERVESLRNELPEEIKKNLYVLKCDVTKEDDIIRCFKWVKEQFGGVDILVNNAGIARNSELVKPDNSQDMRDIVDTNIMGVMYCTREAFNSMKERKSDGHIVNINSIAGHRIPNFGDEAPSFNIYPATKYAVTAMTETCRQEFRRHGTKVRITSISPGATDTEIFPPGFAEIVKTTMPMLRPEDVSNAIIYAISTPPHVQIHEIIIKPVGEVC